MSHALTANTTTRESTDDDRSVARERAAIGQTCATIDAILAARNVRSVGRKRAAKNARNAESTLAVALRKPLSGHTLADHTGP